MTSITAAIRLMLLRETISVYFKKNHDNTEIQCVSKIQHRKECIVTNKLYRVIKIMMQSVTYFCDTRF